MTPPSSPLRRPSSADNHDINSVDIVQRHSRAKRDLEAILDLELKTQALSYPYPRRLHDIVSSTLFLGTLFQWTGPEQLSSQAGGLEIRPR